MKTPINPQQQEQIWNEAISTKCSFKSQCDSEPNAYRKQFCGCYNQKTMEIDLSQMPDYDELLLTVQSQKEIIQELQTQLSESEMQNIAHNNGIRTLGEMYEDLQKKYDALTIYVKERNL